MTSIDYSEISVCPRPRGFGAEVTGIALNKPLAASALAEMQRAWTAHSVIYFPDQPLEITQLENFGRQFGPFGEDPYVKPLAGHPNVLEVRREAEERAAVFGAAWHSDWSFQATPPSATILHAKIVPPLGGNTLFADSYRAFDGLSEVMREKLQGLATIHSAAAAYGPRGVFAQESAKRAMEIIVSETAQNTQTHPLVRTHPVSGRRALFINPVYTVGIVGMTKPESDALLRFLFEHMQREEFLYRHQWQPHMLTMWDNRCTMHHAEGGYDGHQRVLHRVTIAGERPA